ncbi:MAG: MotA/TolQ/ExbB proton channel family protein [Candidatus Omnitrophica bacterium]|nr:MotA/TolQ/ExbB proton channel family protein [Candidatus Omnitrophota bacterium]
MLNRMAQTALCIIASALIGVTLFWRVDIIARGGPVMIAIVMCSVFSLALIMERLYYFISLHLGPDIDRRFAELRSHLEGHRWKEAAMLCGSWQGPVARVVQAGLAIRDSSPQEIDEAMEEAAHEEMPKVEQHLRWLSTLAQVSTLLGLLGTVTGLVRAFQVIQNKSSGGNPVSPGDLAGGVWEALITTVAGLLVAIPTILAYNYFAGRVVEAQFQMEKAAALVSGWRQIRERSQSVSGAGSK